MTEPLAVYVHVPFCTVKCGYCDFNAYAGMHSLADEYNAALLREIDACSGELAGRAVSSVYFGGGTPSEVPAAHTVAVLDALRTVTTLEPGCEVTLEANPGSIDGPGLAALREAGVTRLSIGAQSFDPGDLRFLDRIHSPEATASIVREARRAGFESLSLDLIYGLPGQSQESWQRSLDAALALSPDHISLYSLTVEEGTPLASGVEAGRVTPLPDDDAADMYEAARRVLGTAGYGQYELSNFARPGYESRHNQAYWTDREFLGIGAGAHGYLGFRRYENVAHPRAYIEATRTGRAVAAEHDYDPVLDVFDWISLRLRLAAGIEEAAFHASFSTELSTMLGPVLVSAIEAGVLVREGGTVRLHPERRLLHGELSARMLAHLQSLVPRDLPTRLVGAVR